MAHRTVRATLRLGALEVAVDIVETLQRDHPHQHSFRVHRLLAAAAPSPLLMRAVFFDACC